MVLRPWPMPTSSERPGLRPVVTDTRKAFGAVLKRGAGAVRMRFQRSISARSPIDFSDAMVAVISRSLFFPARSSAA